MSDLQSVRRALQVLSVLQDEDELGVSEAAQRLGVSSSTAHRLLSTMEAEGYVRHISGSRRYELGGALQSVRYSAEIDEILDLGRVHMAALRDRSQETVHIAMLAGTATRFLAASESPHIMRVGSRVGQRLPAHRTAAGKLLLSQLPGDEAVLRYRRTPPDSPDSVPPEAMAALVAELERTRVRGFAFNHGESELGVAALAVPLRTPGGDSPCCLTISGPASRINPERGPALSEREEELLGMLRESAAAIEAGTRRA